MSIHETKKMELFIVEGCFNHEPNTICWYGIFWKQ